MPKEYINPPELFPSFQYGFSQIIACIVGGTVFISGQVAWDERQQIIGPDDLLAQARQTTTWIGVRALANKEFLIEIEAIAVIE